MEDQNKKQVNKQDKKDIGGLILTIVFFVMLMASMIYGIVYHISHS